MNFDPDRRPVVAGRVHDLTAEQYDLICAARAAAVEAVAVLRSHPQALTSRR
jgi:hypothetical protein